MLLSLALILLCGYFLGKIFEKLKLPNLLGMLITGIILGPYVLNLLDISILNSSADLRKIALIIILARAGVNLDLKELKQVGRPAILLCFVPACIEIAAVSIFAPMFLGITLAEALLLGTVLAAVSPAVVVPRMLIIKEKGYGTSKSLPQMIMAASSVDDVFVIVMFTACLGFVESGKLNLVQFLSIPTSIILGIACGFTLGFALSYIFKKIHIRDSVKMLIIMSIAFLLISLENALENIIGFSGILAVMTMGMGIKLKNNTVAERVSNKLSKFWIVAEIMLFALVGASVDINFALNAGINTVILIISALVFRILAVFICLIGTKFNKKEKFFSAISYMPKATVQAAIGGIPLAMGLSCGNVILTTAVLAIFITAPVGAILIDNLYTKLLEKKDSSN